MTKTKKIALERTINVQRDHISFDQAVRLPGVTRIEDQDEVWVIGRRGWRQLGVYDG